MKKGWKSLVRVGVKVGCAAVLILFILFVAEFIWANFITDEAFREAQYESGMEKVIIYEFRDHFHGRADYAPKTLKQLHDEGVLSDDSYDFIRSGSYRYVPFSPTTPDEAFVLRIGWPLIGDVFHKGDFTAGRSDPDIVI